MGIYIEGAKKPECCSRCPDVRVVENECGHMGRQLSQTEWIFEPPSWCPIIEVPKEEFEMGREAVERIKKALDEAVMTGKSKRQEQQEWSTQRFYNMDSALTRIEELAQQMQEEAKKIGDIVNEGFTVKPKDGGDGDESRTEDA